MHAIFVVLAMVSAPPQLESPVLSAEQAQTQLEGTWVFVDAEEKGKKVPQRENAKGLRELKWVFRGDKLALRKGDEGKEFEYRVDPAKSPKEIDLTLSFGGEKPVSALAIYKLEEKTLTICLGDKQGTTRPQDFKTAPGSQFAIIVLRRAE